MAINLMKGLASVQDYKSSESQTDYLTLEDADIDYAVYSGFLIGTADDTMNFYNHIHCGCQGDCCGCISSVSQEVEQIDSNLVKVTKTYTYNY